MARPRKPINQQKGHLTKEYQEQRKLEEAFVEQSDSEIYKPPDWLIDDNAKNEWNRLVNEFKGTGMFGNLDIDNLAGFCNAFAGYKKATLSLKKSGMIIKDKNGKVMENPYINTQRKYAQEMREFGKLCGLTVDSRLRFASTKVDTISEQISNEFGDI